MMRLITLLLITALVACQEEITPVTTPNNPGNGNGNPTPPDNPVPGKYANCLGVLSNTTLDVVTWNIENFPQNGNTVPLLKEMIEAMNPDIIAVQEIGSASNFTTLINSLSGFEGIITNSGSQRLGFIYKPAEITAFSGITELFTDDGCAFPRAALKTTITHVSGRQVTLINVHLKCCDDFSASCGSAITRRTNAGIKIKSYIEQNLANASVIVLGDFNEDITQPEGNNVFTNFVNDANNFRFADMDIAEGPSSGWSYPSWPSHIDHLLITNELFDHVQEVRTLTLNSCESSYYTNVSDHRPVLLRLKDLN
jgi:endonuclease/exonuclease/phosphatase family metal-dependent hydrolase